MAEPRCKYFGTCGGCAAQDVDYELQLATKLEGLRNAIGAMVEPSVHSGGIYNYRNRLDLVVSEGGLGFHVKGRWWKIIEIERCEIAAEKINRLIGEFRAYFEVPDYFHLKQKSGTLKHVVLRASRHEAALSFVVNPESDKLQAAIEQITDFAGGCSAQHVLLTKVSPNSSVSVADDYRVIKGCDLMREEISGKTFYYPLQGFFQTNTDMSERMHDYCRALICQYATKDMQLLDLYGGVGTFGIINADLFRKVLVVESVSTAIEAARKNAQVNSVQNLEALTLDAKHLKQIELESPLFVISDPPRSGMDDKTIERLRELQPEVIVYVSCNMKQLLIDLPKLSGYKLKSAALFDLFPHTPHAEAVIELIRN